MLQETSEFLSTFLLHHLEPFQRLSMEVLQVLGPADLNKHVFIEVWGSWGLVIIVISLWNSLNERRERGGSAWIKSHLLL